MLIEDAFCSGVNNFKKFGPLKKELDPFLKSLENKFSLQLLSSYIR